ncbi:MAG: glycosyltransferase [Labilithrix sp.]|nr:glycosyltransferase [Labilithrix sp.]
MRSDERSRSERRERSGRREVGRLCRSLEGVTFRGRAASVSRSARRHMRSLYISQNGMAENLGQSQVLPYLRGLARRGVEIDLVSFELSTVTAEAREAIRSSLAQSGIRWHPLSRTMRAPLAVKVQEAARGVSTSLRAALARPPDIIHGRSYFATAIADVTGQVSRRSKVLFDCRGMIGDEYVDCGHWTKERIEYRLVKTYERRLFRQADGIVTLTHALARWLKDNHVLGSRPALEVIPCCVDMDRFRPSEEARTRLRRELRIDGDLTIVYAGSLGTWYLEPEMARFAAAVRRHHQKLGGRVSFVCFTPSDASRLQAQLAKTGFAETDVVVRKVEPSRMPEYLCVGDVGLSFIQSCFSKTGSSPTKVAEYLACGNVAVVNGDIGDQTDLATENGACVVLDDFSNTSIERCAREVVALATRPRPLRTSSTVDAARRHFDLERVGVARYARLYDTLMRAR